VVVCRAYAATNVEVEMVAVEHNEAASYRRAFRSFAAEYYAAGRSAARSGLYSVAGQILHHALEYFIKADLVATISARELATRRVDGRPVGHDLAYWWAQLRSTDGALGRFDATITALNHFELIRYPDRIVGPDATTTTLQVPFRRGEGLTNPALRSQPGIEGTTIYVVCIEEIDEIVITLLERDQVEPWQLTLLMTESAHEAIRYLNQAVSRWIPPEQP
jgi:hypothetical protein